MLYYTWVAEYMIKMKLLLQIRLYQLEKAHRILDDSIAECLQSSSTNMLEVQRLKRQKLVLRDEIIAIRRHIIPDILA